MKYLSIILILALLVLSACSAPSAEQVDSVQEELQDIVENDDAANAEDEVEDVLEAAGVAPVEETSTSFEGFGLSYVVNGETFAYENAQVMAQTPVADYLTIVAPDATGIQLRTLPNEVGTYVIGEGPGYREVNVWFVHEGTRYDADTSKGSGEIVFDTVGSVVPAGYEGAISGTFFGTFVDSSGNELVVEDGVFNADGILWG